MIEMVNSQASAFSGLINLKSHWEIGISQTLVCLVWIDRPRTIKLNIHIMCASAKIILTEIKIFEMKTLQYKCMEKVYKKE